MVNSEELIGSTEYLML